MKLNPDVIETLLAVLAALLMLSIALNCILGSLVRCLLGKVPMLEGVLGPGPHGDPGGWRPNIPREGGHG